MSRCAGRPAYKTRCRDDAEVGSFCRDCAARERPGQAFFLGRWRTRGEVYQRIAGDRAMRGVVWTEAADAYVGVWPGGEIRLRK